MFKISQTKALNMNLRCFWTSGVLLYARFPKHVEWDALVNLPHCGQTKANTTSVQDSDKVVSKLKIEGTINVLTIDVAIDVAYYQFTCGSS